jgi:hypothetical protein
LSRSISVTKEGGSDWMAKFIDALYTPFRTTINNSDILDLQTLQFAVAHTQVFSVLSTKILAIDL